MTREDRWIVSIDEIAALRWQCFNCKSAVTFQLDQTVRFPETCPNCRENAVNADYVPAHSSMDRFAEALKALARLNREHPDAGTISLEFAARPSVRGL